MDGNQTEEMEGVEASEDVIIINKSLESSSTCGIPETGVESSSENPLDESKDDVDEDKKEGSDEESGTGMSANGQPGSESPEKDKSSDDVMVLVDEISKSGNVESSGGEDKVESMDFDILCTDINEVEKDGLADSRDSEDDEKDGLADSRAGEDDEKSEEDKTDTEATKPDSPISSVEKNANPMEDVASEKDEGEERDVSKSTPNTSTDEVEVVGAIDKDVDQLDPEVSKEVEDCEITEVEKDNVGDGDEEIVEVPIVKKPTVVVDLANDEDASDKTRQQLEGNDGSEELNSEGSKRIKLRSLASLVDNRTEDPPSTLVSTSHPDIPAIGEIVEHGVIIGSDEMDGLGLRISNVVGGEDCITGLTIDEDRDAFSTIQISSVTTLMDPMSPEDPNKENGVSSKPVENEKNSTNVEATAEGESEKTTTDNSQKPSEGSPDKGVQVVDSENLASKEDANKSTESAGTGPQLTPLTVASKADGTISETRCVYHVLRSILTVNRECFVCSKSKQCEFRVTKKGESGSWAFLCTTECRTRWTESLPSDHQIEKPRLIFEKLCGMCGKDLASVSRSGQFSWETREFCTRKCLTLHLTEVASECHMCHDEVRAMFIGKYCVRFGSDIHQFCSNVCLERYKTKIKVCCYCQKNLEKVKRVSSMANKEYCSMKCLKRAQRRDIGQQNYNEHHPCTVCVTNGPNRYEFLSNKENFQLCSDPCLNVYKYANRVKAVSCCLCFRVMNAEDVGHYLYHGGHQLRVFCSDSCVNVFILSARKIVVCNYCKVKKYNFDMIHRQEDEDFRDYFYCSLNCLNSKEPMLEKGQDKNSSDISTSTTVANGSKPSESADAPPTTCNMCSNVAKPQYHMVMSDNTLRSFCRYACASKYKTTYGFQISGIQNSDSTQPSHSFPIIRPKSSQTTANTTEDGDSASKTKPVKVNAGTQGTANASAELLKLLTPPIMVNKMTSCRPFTLTKGVYCKPHPWHRYTQTEQSEADNMAPRSDGPLASSQIRELMDLGAPQSDISSESEVGGCSENEGDSDSTMLSENEEESTVDSFGKRKATSHTQEPARKAQKLDDSLVTSYLTDSSHPPSPSDPPQFWEWDFKSEFTRTVLAFNASSSGVSPSCGLTKESSEVDFFCLFFDQDIVGHICQETQRYHKQKQEASKMTESSKSSDWHEPSVAEIYRFLGLAMLMAHIRKSNMREYWNTDPLFSTPAFLRLMQRNRFMDILQFLHFANNNEVKRDDNLAKIRPILDHFREKFKRTIKPFQDVCIEEGLILLQGHSSAELYTSRKQHLLGRKCFVMIDLNTNIIIDMIGCSGIDTDVSSSDLGYGAGVIQKLLSDYHDKNHVVYLDHWYTSPKLFEFLHQHGLGAVGVVRATQKGMPSFEAVKRGMTASAHTHNMLAVKWMDRREVHMLSTIHEDVMVKSGKRDQVTGEVVEKPKVLVDYRKKIKVVDHSNMLVTSTDFVQKCRKWYKKFFFHLLDIVVLNAYHLYLVKTGNKPTLSDFKRNIIQTLFKRFPQAKPSLDETGVVSPLHRLNAPHYPSCSTPTLTSSEPEGLCYVCANTERSERKNTVTKTMCVECDVSLCQFPCFADYHKLKQF